VHTQKELPTATLYQLAVAADLFGIEALGGGSRIFTSSEAQDTNSTIGQKWFTSSVSGITRHIRPIHQLDRIDAIGKDQVARHLGSFIVDVVFDQMNEMFILLGKSGPNIPGCGGHPD
jgi:hypothetical protein